MLVREREEARAMPMGRRVGVPELFEDKQDLGRESGPWQTARKDTTGIGCGSVRGGQRGQSK